MTEEEQIKADKAIAAAMRAAYPLIESSPNYPLYLIARTLRAPLNIVAAMLDGYRKEWAHFMDAQAVYLGPGK
jgi:hypothetical protein